MGVMGSANLTTRSWAFPPLALLGLLASAGQAHAQADAQKAAVGVAETSSQTCEVVEAGGTPEGLRMLEAHCGSNVLLLGTASEFSLSGNKDLNATVIDMKSGAQRRVLLLSVREDGAPVLEDLSGQIAEATGRGRMMPISDLDVDLQTFAEDGKIAVASSATDNSAPQWEKISVGEQVAVERAARAANSEQ